MTDEPLIDVTIPAPALYIAPELGMHVHLHPDPELDHGRGRLNAAIITLVRSEGMVNLACFDTHGNAWAATSVVLIQPGHPSVLGRYCTPTPDQIERAELRLRSATDPVGERSRTAETLAVPI